MTQTSTLARGPVPFLAQPRAAYVHIPFCSHKCGYCDFASVAGMDEWADRYLSALDREMEMILGAPVPVETIFVGGGTPTYLSPTQLERLMARLGHWLLLDPDGEFTVESNPNTLTAVKVAILADHSVNRVSLGAQSFQPHLLARLERDHDPDSVARAFDLLRPRIPNLSLDLIFGIFGQTLDEWRRDLDQAVALAPEHLSAYGLMYEKGTPLWKQRRLGIIEPIDDGLEADMYEHLLDRLNGNGWEQYEISNFARQANGARRCRHNGVYWANLPYYGFGTGAASFVGGERNLNLRPLVTYIERVESGQSPVCQTEVLDPESRARETAVLQLRRNDGLERISFRDQTGFSIDDLAEPALQLGERQGLLFDDGRTVRLTRQGLLLADGILSRIV